MSMMETMVEKRRRRLLTWPKRYIGVDSTGKLRDSDLRTRLTRHLMNSQVNEWTRYRLFEQYSQGVKDSSLALIMKHISTTEIQRKDELMLAILVTGALSWHDAEYSSKEQRLVKTGRSTSRKLLPVAPPKFN